MQGGGVGSPARGPGQGGVLEMLFPRLGGRGSGIAASGSAFGEQSGLRGPRAGRADSWEQSQRHPSPRRSRTGPSRSADERGRGRALGFLLASFEEPLQKLCLGRRVGVRIEMRLFHGERSTRLGLKLGRNRRKRFGPPRAVLLGLELVSPRPKRSLEHQLSSNSKPEAGIPDQTSGRPPLLGVRLGSSLQRILIKSTRGWGWGRRNWQGVRGSPTNCTRIGATNAVSWGGARCAMLKRMQRHGTSHETQAGNGGPTRCFVAEHGRRGTRSQSRGWTRSTR